MKLCNLLVLAGLVVCASASAVPLSFPECPAVGYDTTGCEFLITVTAASGGAATAFTVATSSPDLGPYDGNDDTLVGVLNKSGSVLNSALSSTTDIFAFDGDGPCTYISCPGGPDASGYAPADVTYSNINSTDTARTVNFSIANGASAWFGLEEALTASQIMPGNSTPEPSSVLLFGVGLGAIAAAAWRRRRT
jgi:hypothetical protein